MGMASGTPIDRLPERKLARTAEMNPRHTLDDLLHQATGLDEQDPALLAPSRAPLSYGALWQQTAAICGDFAFGLGAMELETAIRTHPTRSIDHGRHPFPWTRTLWKPRPRETSMRA